MGRIHFGTAGWRAVIGEDFTFDNVRRLCQTLANVADRDGSRERGVVIGYDRRFLSDIAARVAAEVFAGNGMRVFLSPHETPTPLINYATLYQGAAFGVMFTASHNPPEWNGMKVFHGDGALLNRAEVEAVAEEASLMEPDEVTRLDFDSALESGLIRMTDYTDPYLDAIEGFVDMDVIRKAGLRIAMDPMYGVGHLVLEPLLLGARCRVTAIHTQRDPLFGGRPPTPEKDALRELLWLIQDGDFDLGLALDGDADRLTVVDGDGDFVHPNEILLLVYYYLHEVKGQRGGIVRNVSTTHMVDRLARLFGEPCYETPVGFMHVAGAMWEHDCLIAGESSGGLTIRGYIPGKDGVLAAMLIVDMLAGTGKSISEMLAHIHGLIGRLFSYWENFRLTEDMRASLADKVNGISVESVGPYPVLGISHMDGTRFSLEDDNWLLLRFSGTEPLLRIYAEADTPEKARELVRLGGRMLGLRD